MGAASSARCSPATRSSTTPRGLRGQEHRRIPQPVSHAVRLRARRAEGAPRAGDRRLQAQTTSPCRTSSTVSEKLSAASSQPNASTSSAWEARPETGTCTGTSHHSRPAYVRPAAARGARLEPCSRSLRGRDGGPRSSHSSGDRGNHVRRPVGRTIPRCSPASTRRASGSSAVDRTSPGGCAATRRGTRRWPRSRRRDRTASSTPGAATGCSPV